jgi:uncharacterized membrane protein YheB (UPF0754 family)
VTPELLRALLTIGFGSLAGGLTNTVAVWMLFHPYRPIRFAGRDLPFLHGAIPKNQGRLAEAVGRAVGDRLLTEQDLTAIFANREFREAFDRQLGAFLENILEGERASPRDMLPPGAVAEVEGILDGLADHLADRLEEWIHSPSFEAMVDARSGALIDRIGDVSVGELLTPEREGILIDGVERWLGEVVEQNEFREAIDSYLDGFLRGVLREDRTFEEVLPGGLAEALEGALARFLPVAARRLGGVLDDPDARRRLERTLKELFQRFLRDLRFHQRVMARLVVTDDTLDRILATLEEEGAEQLSETLRDPAIQDAIARRVSDGMVELMRRPVTQVIGAPDDPGVRRGRETLTDWLAGVARDPSSRAYIVEKLEQGVGRIARGTWNDLLRSVPRERMVPAVTALARSEAASRVYRDAIRRALRSLLDRRVGRPGDWLSVEARNRVEGAISEPLWRWLQGQVPKVVRTLNVGRRVEEKVRGYPVERMEELVKRVTERELRLIVRLGYFLGAVIGVTLVLLTSLVG